MTFLPLFDVGSTEDFGSTLDEQTTEWSNHSNMTGTYGLSSDEVDARSKSKLSKLLTTKYSPLSAKSGYFQLGLNYGLTNAAPLRKEVQDDLDNAEIAPTAFFKEYGTHYLMAVSVGARVTISCTLDTSKLKSKFGLDVLLKASYGEKTEKISAENQTTFDEDLEKFREHGRTTILGAGTSEEQIDTVAQGTKSGVAVLKGGWHNPTLIDFPKDALRPIWLRCGDEARKNAFQAEFDRIVSEKKDVAALHALYTPVYLYRYFDGWWLICYRFHHGGELAGSPEANGVNWELQNNGEPLFHVLSQQLPGSVPLFEYRHAGDDRLWRYETGTWSAYIDFLASADYRNGVLGHFYGRTHCHRVSSKPIGYVLDPEENRLDGITARQLRPYTHTVTYAARKVRGSITASIQRTTPATIRKVGTGLSYQGTIVPATRPTVRISPCSIHSTRTP